jgi:DNA-binding HxlR family transcriptional regulator
MKRGYGQYCPLALAAELLCGRWTILVVSRLLDGCAQFNEIHRGIPRISPSLLSQRLAELERAGLVVREPAAKARRAGTP